MSIDDGYTYDIHDIDLDAVELFLIKPATPGPWRAVTTGVSGGDHWSIVADGEAIAHVSANDGVNEDQRGPDAKLMAQSRILLPALVERLRIAESAVGNIRALIGPDDGSDADKWDTVSVPLIRHALGGAA
jgi:hypothetical protein